MGLKEKLPLLNSDNKKVRILGYVVYAWIGLAIMGAIVPAPDANIDENKAIKSVDVDGWTFTADLGDRWQTSSDSPESNSYDGYNSGKPWETFTLANAFWLPKTGAYVSPSRVSDLVNSGVENKDLIAIMDILVEKIPKDLQGMKLYDIVLDLTGPIETPMCLRLGTHGADEKPHIVCCLC